MPEIVFPAGWYRREDYERIRLMMDDPDNFPETFDEWSKLAEGQLARFIAQGMPVEKVIIDPDGFAAFCSKAKIAMRVYSTPPRSSADKHPVMHDPIDQSPPRIGC